MRTGSIGGRDAEDLLRTISIEKRAAIATIREALLSHGFSEEVEYDAPNVESVFVYSLLGVRRFLLRHKWELEILFLVYSENEKSSVMEVSPKSSVIEATQDGARANIEALHFHPVNERETVVKLAKLLSEGDLFQPLR